jgi:tetratricopeptide (TPR) repeat protein
MQLSQINKFCIIIICTQLLCACAGISSLSSSEETKSLIKLPQNYDKAIAAAKNGKTADAIKLLSEVTKSYPDFSPAYTNLGLQYLKNKKQDNAEKNLRTAISLNPQDAIAYNHLGIILRHRGKFNDAKDMYNSAIKSKDDYANAHLNLGILYDMYLYELPQALRHYKSYQTITKNSDKLVSKWIIDLERRIAADKRRKSS